MTKNEKRQKIKNYGTNIIRPLMGLRTPKPLHSCRPQRGDPWRRTAVNGTASCQPQRLPPELLATFVDLINSKVSTRLYYLLKLSDQQKTTNSFFENTLYYTYNPPKSHDPKNVKKQF